jgi:hypothetical protein
MAKCGDLIDDKTLNAADLGIAHKAVKAADAKLTNKLLVPADQLIRYNFLEIFLRIAE